MKYGVDAEHKPIDWCSYLFRRMRSGALSAEAFGDNQLRVLIFNFDRLFEQRPFLSVTSSYEISDEDAASLCGQFPVLHIHGRLGRLPWMPYDELNGDGFVREYHPTLSREHRLACVDHIKIVQDEIPTERLDKAHAFLEWAECVLV